MKFSVFIRDNIDAIVHEWETFAVTIPAAQSMSGLALRDHCRPILLAIADDMETSQTNVEQAAKSKDMVPLPFGGEESAAQTHGTLRHSAGFGLAQLFAEFRALRASVLALWNRSEACSAAGHGIYEVTRFNEGLDQALAESVDSFSNSLAASRDMFLGVLGQDLRAPLLVIADSNFYLNRPGLTSAEREVASARLATQVDEITGLISNLLDFTRSRLGAGIPIERSPCDIGEVCVEALDSIKARYHLHRFFLTREGELLAVADASKIGQALANLLLNAAKYGQPGGTITLNAVGNADSIVLKVINHGPVIAPESLPSLFEPLPQSSRPGQPPDRASTSGMGLGLFIVREIVNGHLGTITVESAAGLGTVFTIQLPRDSAIE
jgi:signal transduction histidine kinase